jgi:hypothetical protein
MRWTLLGAALLTATSINTASCGRSVASQIHLIPKGYTGPVVLVFNDATGQDTVRREGLSSVFDIPTNGILRLRSSSPDPQILLVHHYYVDADGTRREIPHGGDENTVQVFGVEAGSVGSVDIVNSGSRTTHNNEETWMLYFIGAPASHSQTEWRRSRAEVLDSALANSR